MVFLLGLTVPPTVSACTSPGGGDGGPGRTVDASPTPQVPNLVGLNKDEAVRIVDDLNVPYFVKPLGPPLDNSVIGQRPDPGTPLSETRSIVLQVRCAAAPCPSPPAGTVIFDPCTCATR